MSRKIILYELNEVPLRIVDEFCAWRPQSTLARTLPDCRQFESFAEDDGLLSPWITWPTLHRGVANQSHLIHDFGQDLSEVDERFPPIWKILAGRGVSTGVCGSLHTYPMPDDLENYSFFLPDTFASGSECFPKDLEVFQEFNLQMARRSARNVAAGVPWSSALTFLSRAPGLGLKPTTLLDVGLHLMSEKARRWKKVRRRTYQAVLAFDIFERFLHDTKPAFSTFFTNHVASSLHRYWAARFPGDYDSFHYDDEWVRTYVREIEFTMSKADAFFARLVRFADANPDYQVWVATSMGQEATEAEPMETQLYMTDRARFMRQLGLTSEDWEECPAMLPRYTFKIKTHKVREFRQRIATLTIAGEALDVSEEGGDRFFVKLGQRNLRVEGDCAMLGGKVTTLADLGLENTEIEDRSGTTAYHIPQGALFIYDPKMKATSTGRSSLTTRDIAPAILRNFSVPVPEYMNKPILTA